jgi:chemotaxis protein methyltransferase CheR
VEGLLSEAATLARGHPALSDRQFEQVCALLQERAGIHLSDAKRRLVMTRLAPRLRATGSRSFSDYLELVADEASAESEHFLNALTTNVTGFFREPHHFEILEQRVLPAVSARPARDDRLRFWCAACSTGEEPYSLAITLLESGVDPEQRDVRILATDIDSRVLAHAAEGVYELDRVKDIPPRALRRYFSRGTGARAGLVRVKPRVRALVEFGRLNLLGPWPMSGPFDLILCRNVIIYFEQAARTELIRRFSGILGARGYLFLGHSESMTGSVCSLFEALGHTVFLKRGGVKAG